MEEESQKWQSHKVRSTLRDAIKSLSNRGLKKSAAWAAEVLQGIAEAFAPTSTTGRASSTTGKSKKRLFDEEAFPEVETPDTDTFLIAKSMFDLDEYLRCAYLISPSGNAPTSANQKELFLWAYSLFLAGEKRKEEEMCEVGDPLEQCQVTNANLKLLRNELSILQSKGTMDGYMLYLYGVVLKEMQAKPAARLMLCQSVQQCPINWSAWLDLASLCTEKEDLDNLVFPDHWMVGFFKAHLALEQQQNNEASEILTNLSGMFPTSSYVLSQKALAEYNLRNFDEAQLYFESLLEKDPHRLTNMDTYSNILYVKECKAELSYLAHTSVRSNKYRPETCCIIGNYYSLKAQHERAVIYFKRALRLNRRYLSAWTLMGHEYVEMKNTEAAIEAYRSAVDINARDYRAWYGLGQTYEILLMYFYALHYYRKATTLRPYDARMWCAQAGCYARLSRTSEAIKCYKRAECHNDREGIAAMQLAKLYSEKRCREQAAHYYKKHLDRRRVEDAMGGLDAVEALKYLASYLKDEGNLAEAEKYCEQLLEYTGPEKKEAEAMLREIRQLRASANSGQ